MPASSTTTATSRSSIAPRTSASSRQRRDVRPNYIENKLKFFPHIKGSRLLRSRPDMVCAFINIDVGAVGNWAERRGIAYSGYADLCRQSRRCWS